eukprot:gene13047-biopygen11214
MVPGYSQEGLRREEVRWISSSATFDAAVDDAGADLADDGEHRGEPAIRSCSHTAPTLPPRLEPRFWSGFSPLAVWNKKPILAAPTLRPHCPHTAPTRWVAVLLPCMPDLPPHPRRTHPPRSTLAAAGRPPRRNSVSNSSSPRLAGRVPPRRPKRQSRMEFPSVAPPRGCPCCDSRGRPRWSAGGGPAQRGGLMLDAGVARHACGQFSVQTSRHRAFPAGNHAAVTQAVFNVLGIGRARGDSNPPV